MPAKFNSFFNSVEGGNEAARCHYPTRLDTYGCGCQHNYGYCYARSLLDFRGLWNPALPATADIRKIRNIIAGKLYPGDVIRLGGMTDCFQPIEQGRRLTYRTIKMLNQRRVHYLIVTKSDLVASDPYMEILDPELAHIQVSITSTDPALSKRLEPGAPVPARRIAAVERLTAAGYDAQVRLSPFVPEFVDLSVINAIKCDKILVEFLRVNTWIRKWLTDLGAGVDLDRYTLFSSGYNHLPIGDKRALVDRITGFREVSVCEDVPEHWDWWQKHVNANKQDCCNINLYANPTNQTERPRA